ncbi:sodium/hydrogen exchanger 8-like isoform X1 [Limulus polyphemus]|uniref:Sodium/hydrogen exchanger n=2 Tax=Limulus polyphemus TaxID=6850 RepID=A0ABM1T5T9_LIMPO|nr:sodium/hydrogen exchanger 8-like isoform X1 [Limulus polyphemus]XP_022251246.1 sodium/hydrogen exchanger 8-like isoform X1 [Limulus polyphemus]
MCDVNYKGIHMKWMFIIWLLVPMVIQGQQDLIAQEERGHSNGSMIMPQSNMTELSNKSEITNGTTLSTTETSSTVLTDSVLPQKGAAEAEHHSSMSIFFVLSVIAVSTLLVHFILQTKFHYLPESVAVVFLGALIGLFLKLISSQHLGNWQKEEAFNPTAFFLILLPPIIYESGYNLHKGNFFQNIGSILIFAIIGTTVSALIVGGGVYLLGLADVAYRLNFTESLAFGSLISAVDPVATLAIFHALDIDPILNMLVFGESILNDAVAIVLATTVLESSKPEMATLSTSAAVLHAIGRFCMMFFASAGIGVAFALMAALLLKYIDLRKNPSLEFAIMLIFSYAPYGLAEGLHLSGIMAILFNGVVMSHYTHFNLSPVTQITMQQTLRTLAFIAETSVFAYLGLAIFSFRHIVKPSLVIWSIVLILIGRGANIFPLSFLMNYFREHKITKKMMFIMWFSGLRGAIAYALALHLEFENEKRHVMVTTTLIIVLFTILVLGGSTMPLMKFLKAERKNRKRRGQEKEISLSKTKEMGQTIDAEHLSELTEEEYEVNFMKSNLKGFVRLDVKYLIPFFTRRFTHQEVKDCKTQMTDLTNQWYQAIRGPSETEEESEETLM